MKKKPFIHATNLLHFLYFMRASCVIFFVAVLMVPQLNIGFAPHASVAPAFAEEFAANAADFPARISIRSIALNSPIQPVGVNSQGEMDVPDGSTNLVGWYKYGKLPGELGNAVMDAHVYAAFKKLRYAQIGDEIVVANARGEEERFVITDSRVYAVADVPMHAIFTQESERGLVLITCAKKYIPSLGTYSHRLVVSAKRVD